MKPIFHFDRYEVSGSKVNFYYHYSNGDEKMAKFTETLTFPFEVESSETTKQILKYLHLLSGVSYYKSLLGEVQADYELTASEVRYLNSVYNKGLGEFAYVNKLKNPIQPFTSSTSNEQLKPSSLSTSGALLGIGGGKDSIVAGELLKKFAIPTSAFTIGSRDNHGQADKVIELLEFENIGVERHVDVTIVDFTKKHTGYNGHVPISAIIAWIGLLIAEQKHLRYVVVANESASNEGNVTWNDQIVNHQWSKSLEFEKLTQTFIKNHVTPDITYLSLIRPFSSLKVIQLLVETGDTYLHTFTSCNLVLRIDPTGRPNGRWCGQCAKCLSTFLLLTLFLPYEKVTEIFGKDLLDDESLRSLLRSLVGLEGHKPLDCVGTIDELRAAVRNLLDAKGQKPLLVDIKSKDLTGPASTELINQPGEHSLPKEFAKLIQL